jgi:toxin ParE1/3/4
VIVRYTRKALEQLDQVLAYIEADNPAASQRVKLRITRSIDQLSRFPYRGRATERPDIRLLPVVRYPYLVFYRVEEKAQEVQILRVRHSARNPKQHLD